MTGEIRSSRRGRRRVIRALLALALCGGIYAAGARRIESGPATGTQFENAERSAAATTALAREFTVQTFNIHGAKGTDRARDVARVAECLRSADFAGLNEVYGPSLWLGDGQAEALGGALGRSWLFAPTESRFWHGAFGNAALSSLDVRGWRRVPLPLGGAKSHRNVLWVTAHAGEQPVQFLVTHLDRRDPATRREQLRAVGDWFLALTPPAVLMGDLNSTADEPELRRLLENGTVHDPLQDARVVVPAGRIDWILTRGLQTVEAGLVETAASDHPYVWARVATIEWQQPSDEPDPSAERKEPNAAAVEFEARRTVQDADDED